MSTEVGATLLGLLAAFLFAGAAYYQQRAARETTREGHGALAGAYNLMAKLVRDPVWLKGWLVNLAGFGAQAAALHLGSVAVVQPLLATQLLFAMPMASLERRRWPRWRDWGAGLAICAGLVVLLVVVHAVPSGADVDRSKIVLAALSALAAIVVLVPIASRLGPDVMVLVAGACAGICFAMTAVFIKLTSDDLLNHGIAHTATDWVGYALAVSTALGLVLEQAAFANGPLPWGVATKESVNPIASYAVGVLAFPIVLPSDGRTIAGLVVAGLLLIVGAVGLAHSPSSDLWIRRESDQSGGEDATLVE
jgi:hypothetical protein